MNNQGYPEIKPPPPSANHDHTKIGAPITTEPNLECHLESITILEEFSLLVSQALPQSNLGSLGPKPRPVSQALLQSKPGSLCPKPRLLPQYLSCILQKPVKGFLGLSEWTLRPPPPRILKSNWKTKAQNRDKHPNIWWHPAKGKARMKTTIITRENHATDHKRTIHQHANPWLFNLWLLSCYRNDNIQQPKVALIGLCASDCILFSIELCQWPQNLSHFSSPESWPLPKTCCNHQNRSKTW